MPASSEILEREILERRELARRVRAFMRDSPELNTIIDGVESSDELTQDAIELVIDEVNSTPPPIGAFLAQHIPVPILQDGVVSRLIESAAILLMRNDLAFSAGDVTVQLGQAQSYLPLAKYFRDRYESSRDRWKIAMNHQAALDAAGGVFSDWILVSRPSRFFLRDVFLAHGT